MTTMSPRERILRAMRRETTDRTPREARLTLPVEEEFRLRTGASDYVTYFGIDRRFVQFRRPHPPTDFSAYAGEAPAGTFFDEWGNVVVKGPDYRTVNYVYPMRNLSTLSELEEYPFPDFAQAACHAHLDDEVKRIHDEGLAVTGDLWGTFFERSWHMRGMDRLFLDFHDNPEWAGALLDRMLRIRLFQATRYAEADVDILHLGDDIGMQDTLMMSLGMWRRWFKPRMAEVIRTARRIKPDLLVEYHTDGYVEPFIPELIEIGIDVLNPVQPECMDPAEIKRQFGDRMAFSGTVGTQTTMPFGTPEDVRRVVAERIRTVGRGGGLVLAPSHYVEPDVPWENLVAFFEAADEFGAYAFGKAFLPAQPQSSAREVVSRAIRRENPPRTPLYFRTDPERSDLVQVSYRSPSTFLDPQGTIDEWGCRWGNAAGTGTGYVVGHPLADWSSLDGYTFPDPHKPERYDPVAQVVSRYPDKFIAVAMGVSGFSLLTALHGFEDTLVDLHQAPCQIERLADRIFAFEREVIAEIARRGADGIWLFDDWGTERGLFIDPAQWRKVFKPRYRDQFQCVHDQGMAVLLHSCGHVWSIIPDLIEIGVDVLNLEQMHLFDDNQSDGYSRIRETFGGQVCFTVNVDTQRTLPQGSPEDLTREVEHIFRVFASPQGGFIPFGDAGKDHLVWSPDSLLLVERLFEAHAAHGW